VLNYEDVLNALLLKQGGMKAVVWTDTIQIFLMMASVLSLVIKGVIDVGIDNVWERNINTSRIEFFK